VHRANTQSLTRSKHCQAHPPFVRHFAGETPDGGARWNTRGRRQHNLCILSGGFGEGSVKIGEVSRWRAAGLSVGPAELASQRSRARQAADAGPDV